MKPIALVILALGVLAAKAQLTCGGPGCGPDSPLSLQVGGAEFVRISDHSGTPVKFRYSGVRGWAGAPQLSPNFIAVAPASGTTPDNIRIGLNPAVIGSMRSGIHRLEIMFTSVDVDTPRSLHPTTPVVDGEAQRFRILHPFHPFSGQCFEVKGYIRSSHGRRVYFEDPRGCFVFVPETFTDLVPPDPFVALAAGRCFFRTQDLIELLRIVQGAIERRQANV